MEAENENDKKIPIDIRTSKIFLEIANSVSFLKLTVDSPSLHPSWFMPILDLQIKTENNYIIYEFYKKEVSNNLVILNKSAMPMKVKRITCKREILTEFSWSRSTSQATRSSLEVISSGIQAYEIQCARADAGVTPLHRDRHCTGTRSEGERGNCWCWVKPPGIARGMRWGCSPPPGAELTTMIQERGDCQWGGGEVGLVSEDCWDRRTVLEEPTGQNRLDWVSDDRLQAAGCVRVELAVALPPGEAVSTVGLARSVRRLEPLPSTLENLVGVDTTNLRISPETSRPTTHKMLLLNKHLQLKHHKKFIYLTP